MRYCECGCGEQVANRFVHGHNRRIPGPAFIEDFGTNCWLWRRGNVKGYGRLTVDGKQMLAHRAFYEDLVGPIPEGLQIDHLCRDPRCVNPGHMEPVTNRENVLRGRSPAQLGALNGSKTHCKRGHPFDAENTFHKPTGGRSCRTCRREQQRVRRAAGAK